MIQSVAELIAHLEAGNKVKYVYFWGHRKSKTDVTKSCFSQWYEAPFSINGQTYPTAEHFMMAQKAELFDDRKTRDAILAARTPGEAKKLGRLVSGFDDDIWQKNRFQIVTDASQHKFGQNPELREFLIGTGDRVLVEASPLDTIWGIGLAADDPAAEDPRQWRG